MRTMTKWLVALGSVGAAALTVPSIASAQGIYFGGPGFGVGVGEPYYGGPYYNGQYYNGPYYNNYNDAPYGYGYGYGDGRYWHHRYHHWHRY
jgi:hypothetical protein